MAEFTFEPMTPTAYLDRAGTVFAERTAIIDGTRTFSYASFAERSVKLANSLRARGLEIGARVAALCVNSHVMLELHNAVPRAGLALVPLNIRLSVDELSYIVEHSGAALMIATAEFANIAHEVASRVGVQLVVASGSGIDDYESLIEAGEAAALPPVDEGQLLGISYTSGTTGRPKGVMYHHRGAYLQALAMAYHCMLRPDSAYLWTLPMFHCHGWCFTWGVTAAGATHVCARTTDPEEVWRLLRAHNISHFCGAPTVLTMLANSPSAEGAALHRPVDVMTGGSPPSPTLLTRMSRLGMTVTHLYGLTETYGPIAINQWQPAWDTLDEDARIALNARQGVGNVISTALRVLDEDGGDVPPDGVTIGEIACRGNNLMLGYYQDAEATKSVTLDGCFRTGDLGVMHPDGYVEIRDRGKDIIISGGENIASVEVERVLDSHPAVLESAVVARPDEIWGEVPVAFVTLRPGQSAKDAELIHWVRQHLAHFKAPKQVTFGALPKTSTGKIQKNVLRQQLRS